jgi:putative Holliday junction resolvase
MGRIMSIDYGKKRVGIAVTDPDRIIATGLTTVSSQDIFHFLEEYVSKENVDCIVVGEPVQMDNTKSEAAKYVDPFVTKLQKQFDYLEIKRMDERFTSKMAMQAMIDGGLKKKARQNKELVDTISATLILQSYLEFINK